MQFDADRDRIAAVRAACDGLSVRERLQVLTSAWIVEADQGRSAALAFPGEFPAEQARQLENCERMMRFVQTQNLIVSRRG